MKVAVDTYGCTRNKADAGLIKKQIEKTPDLKETGIDSSELIILNTCGVKNKTQSKMLNRLKTYREESKKVLVAGCLPKINRKVLEQRKAPMVGPNSIEKIPQAIEEIRNGYRPVYLDGEKKNKLKMDSYTAKGVTGIIPIAEGCLGNCSYCGVKKARGNLHSYPSEQIVEKVKNQIDEGKKQIYLTSQDTGCYGYDTDEELPELLERIANIKGEFKVRTGMMNPEHALKMKEKLAEALNLPNLYSFIHLPIQSGSDKVLEDMNRRYTTREFRETVQYLEKEVEDLNLATDVIVGYPTENEEDLQKTIQTLRETEPDVVNISRFYPRPDTKAEELDPLPSEELKRRSRELTKETKKISKKKNKKYLEEERKALITGENQETYIARLQNYKKVQVDKTQSDLKGKFKTLKITDTGARGLKGEIINT